MFPTVSRIYCTTDDVTKNNLQRSSSFPPGNIRYFSQQIEKIDNTPIQLTRHAIPENLSLLNESKHNDSVSVEFHPTPARDIDIDNYIYAGALKFCAMGNIGITLDKDGHLILIKGTSYDLVHGLWRKYTRGYCYQTARLMLSHGDIEFKHLYIDDDGLLFGREKNTKKDYTIVLSPVTINTLINQQVINLSFHLNNAKNQCDNLNFKTNDHHTIAYFKKNDALYCTYLKENNDWQKTEKTMHTIKVPLHSGYHLSKIKRAMGGVQAVIQSNNKERVVFIAPKQGMNKISHKPPQAFANRLGHDPHEKYHAGLPFTSDRKSNFSSKKIPFFSTLVDNFRINIKKSRHASVKKSQKFIHVVKGIDPGCQAIYTSLPQIAKSINVFGRDEKESKEKRYTHHINLIRKQSHHLAKVANEALGSAEKLNFSQALIGLAQKLHCHETLALSSSHSLATFFGVAAGGFPFVAGWFSGLVLELSNRYSLIMSKTASGAIVLSFNHCHKATATALAGTGQGLEKTLMTSRTIDYLTVMPFEANAIMAAQVITEDCFKFTLSANHFKEFAEQFADKGQACRAPSIFISEAEAIKNKARQFVIKVETRNELRLQAGSMVSPTTYMVFPRTAVGARLACDLLNIKQEKSAVMSPAKPIYSPHKQNLVITSLSTEANLLAEWKIMPIAMHGGGDKTLWCYPLPIVEETHSLKPYKQKTGGVLLEKYFGAETKSPLDPAKVTPLISGAALDVGRVSRAKCGATVDTVHATSSTSGAVLGADQAFSCICSATLDAVHAFPSASGAALNADQALDVICSTAFDAEHAFPSASEAASNANQALDVICSTAFNAEHASPSASGAALNADQALDVICSTAFDAEYAFPSASGAAPNANQALDVICSTAFDAEHASPSASGAAPNANQALDVICSTAFDAEYAFPSASGAAPNANQALDVICSTAFDAEHAFPSASGAVLAVGQISPSKAPSTQTSAVNVDDNIQIKKKITDIMNTPVFLRVSNNQEIKNGLNIKQLATINPHIRALKMLLSPLCKSLATQQRSSQHKVCVIDIIAHYKPLALLSDLNKWQETSFLLPSKDANASTSYRLEKLTFQRTSTLQHKNITIPMPLFNVATVHALSHTQPLGTIDILYKNTRELSPINITHRLSVLY